ncbi:IclR family transcriptional regulator [Lutimaribacter marinistellae]|uniref:IclR family transcriptional regulator n=1 Tax=Lutimaribacter marinistellae TaxID=1820329 RepID=A0ABV7TEU5_9RHOB
MMGKDISTTFAKGLSVLRAFDAENARLSFSDIARICALDRAAARRLVLTLEHLGYVRRYGRVFALTPKVMVLAGGFLQSHQYGKRVQPVLDAASARIDTPLSLAVLEETEALYVAQARMEPSRVSFGFTVGSRLPLLPTAIGMALLTGSSDEDLKKIIEHCLPESRGSDTPSSLDEVVRCVSEARQNGYAVTRGSFEPGVAGVAVPLAGGSGPPFALGTSLALATLTPEREAAIVQALQDCARALADGAG